jgi:putative transposase
MARQKRIHIAGGIYHVITRGLERRRIFKDAADRREFLARLEDALHQTQCQCFAWALLGNHIHLLIRAFQHSLSEFMRKLLAGYAIYFNVKYKRHGYLFQNRFKSILCQEEVYFLELVRYIHLNPVRAGIIKTIDELDRYPWTGHAVIVGKQKAAWQSTDEVLIHYSTQRDQALKAYRQYLLDGWTLGKQEHLIGGGLKRSAGGWLGLKEIKRQGEFWRGEEQILGDDVFVRDALKRAEEELKKSEARKRSGLTLQRLADRVCEMMGVQVYELIKKGRRNNRSYA